MNTSLLISGIIFVFATIVFVYGIGSRLFESYPRIQNPFFAFFNKKDDSEENKINEKELTGEIDLNYLFLSRLQRLIELVYEDSSHEWDQKRVTELNFKFISRGKFVKYYSDNNPNIDINAFDFLPKDFFVLSIPENAQINGHFITSDGGIEVIVYAENIMYVFESLDKLDDAIRDQGLSDYCKYIVFNRKLYFVEDFVKAGFEDKINWVMQKG